MNDNLKRNQTQKNRGEELQASKTITITLREVEENQPKERNKIENVKETGKSNPAKEVERKMNEIQVIEEFSPVKQIQMGPIRSDFLKNFKVKFSPYPVYKPCQEVIDKGLKKIAPKVLEFKPANNQVFVVPSGSKVIHPISPSSIPVSLVNPATPTMKVPIITQVTSLAPGSPVTKFIPFNNVSPVSKSPQGANVISVAKVPLLTQVHPVTKVPVFNAAQKIPLVTTVQKLPLVTTVTKVTSSTSVTNVTSSSKVVPSSPLKPAPKINPCPAPLNSVSSEKEVYDNDKLISDLKQYPLPNGWAYTFTKENKLLFTQYCCLRKFPIFLLIENNKSTKVQFLY